VVVAAGPHRQGRTVRRPAAAQRRRTPSRRGTRGAAG
jgi:hypothetical protein